MTLQAKRSAGWMAEFEEEPDAALDRLLFGTASLATLQSNDPDEILHQLFESASKVQREALDNAMRRWFEKHWWRVPVDQSQWDEILRDAFSACLRLDLEQSLAWLRAAYQDSQARAWLSSLRLGRPRDPEANLLRTLALSQPNTQFLPLWLRLCRLDEERPLHYASLGLMGLSRLPGEDGQPHGDLHPSVFAGIVQMAQAFAARIASQAEAQERWRNEVWSLMARFPRSEHYWTRRFLPCLTFQPASLAAQWLGSMLPKLKRSLQDCKPSRRPPALPPTLQETLLQIRRLGRRPDPELRPDMQRLLDRYRRHAEESGDGEYLVKTLTNLASKVLDSTPEWAQDLTQEAFGWAPQDFKVWAIRAQAEASAGDPLGAISLLWEAKRRMPEIPDVRTNLATLLRRQGYLESAEIVYRQAVADFPSSPVCRNGLAELLKALHRLDEAEAIYRQAVAEFPRNAQSLSGLAGVLRVQQRWIEAEALCQRGVTDFPRNPFFASSLAAIYQAQGKLSQAEPVLLQAVQDFPSDPVCKTGLAVLRLQQGKEKEGMKLLRQIARRFPDDPVAGGFLRKLKRRKSDIQTLVRNYPRFGSSLEPDKIKEDEEVTAQYEEYLNAHDGGPGYGGLAPSPFHNPAAAQVGLAGLYRLAARRESGPRRQEKLRKSLRFSQAVLKSDPGNLSALMEKAFSLLDRGKAGQAESLLADRVRDGECRHVLGLKLGYWRARTLQGHPAQSADWKALSEEFPYRKTLIALERACLSVHSSNGNGAPRGSLQDLLGNLRGGMSSCPKSLRTKEHWLRSVARTSIFPEMGPRRTSLKKNEVAQAWKNLRQSVPLLQGVVEQNLANW